MHCNVVHLIQLINCVVICSESEFLDIPTVTEDKTNKKRFISNLSLIPLQNDFKNLEYTNIRSASTNKLYEKHEIKINNMRK